MDSVYKLIELAQKGDLAAKEQLIKENSGLIWSIVKRFYGRGEQEDLPASLLSPFFQQFHQLQHPPHPTTRI